jgi:hypothetical protein
MRRCEHFAAAYGVTDHSEHTCPLGNCLTELGTITLFGKEGFVC